MPPQCTHNWLVVFQTQRIGQGITRLCLYGINTIQYPYIIFIRISSCLLSLFLLHFQFLCNICRTHPLQIQLLLLPPPLQQVDSIYGEGHRDIFHACVSLRIHQICIAVAGHQQLSPTGQSDDGYDKVLYVQGVIKDDVAPHGIPPLPSCYQLVYILNEPKRIVRTAS